MRTRPEFPVTLLRPSIALIALSAVAALSGCGSQSKSGKGGEQGTPEVGFRVVHPATVANIYELPGRVSAAKTAEVRPQITGVIQQRLFTEGAFVHAGQPLYRIDPSLYRASVAQAQANLASAEAVVSAQEAKAARYKPLAGEGAVAQQDYTDVAAAARQARASVAQTWAALNTARINLRFTTVPSPITGRIGRSLFTEGALVTNGQADPLAVISVLDPIYVDLQQSAADMMKMRAAHTVGGSAPMAATVWLYLDDGTRYPVPGELAFSEVTANPATGTVTMRARFANPGGLLLPGLFVKASVEQGSQSGAFLVPQAALTRDPRGNAQVMVVNAKGLAEIRPVTALRTQGTDWVITSGLSDGDRVITQGLGKAKAGKPVKAVPETAPQVPGSAASKTPAG